MQFLSCKGVRNTNFGGVDIPYDEWVTFLPHMSSH